MFSRLAATATAASTASMNSTRLHDRGHSRFEIMFTVSANTVRLKKNDSTPCSADDAPDDLAGDGDVGDLRGHADDQREIEKIAIVGFVVAGKMQPAEFLVAAFAVIFVRIVQRKDRVHERPRQHDGRHGEQHMDDHEFMARLLRAAELEHDGDQAGQRRGHRQQQNGEGAFVLFCGAPAHPRDVAAPDHDVDQHQIERDADVPAGQQPRRQPPVARQQRR